MIFLEPIEIKDFQDIVEWNKNASEDDLLQWAGPMFNYPLTVEQLLDHYNNSKLSLNQIYLFKIVLTETNQIVGVIELHTDVENTRLGLVKRLLVKENNQGRGIGTEALRLLVDFGFNKCHFNKIQLNVFDFNKHAISSYEKVGFKKSKYIKEARKSKDGFWNIYQMTIEKPSLR